jgi:hypothetical protein
MMAVMTSGTQIQLHHVRLEREVAPKPRIKNQELWAYQKRYDPSADPKLDHIEPLARSQGHLTVGQLHELARWKSKRRADLAKENEGDFVREITSFAFKATYEESRIGALVLLKGVQFPTASVILHFCVDRSYPILDFRALWSLGIERPAAYTSEFWRSYIDICRAMAQKQGMTVRELDMALWQYSKEHQDPK